MIVGFDDILAGEATSVANQLHGLLTQLQPSLERALDPRLQHPAVLTVLEPFGSPARILKAGRRRPVIPLRPKPPRMAACAGSLRQDRSQGSDRRRRWQHHHPDRP